MSDVQPKGKVLINPPSQFTMAEEIDRLKEENRDLKAIIDRMRNEIRYREGLIKALIERVNA